MGFFLLVAKAPLNLLLGVHSLHIESPDDNNKLAHNYYGCSALDDTYVLTENYGGNKNLERKSLENLCYIFTDICNLFLLINIHFRDLNITKNIFYG